MSDVAKLWLLVAIFVAAGLASGVVVYGFTITAVTGLLPVLLPLMIVFVQLDKLRDRK